MGLRPVASPTRRPLPWLAVHHVGVWLRLRLLLLHVPLLLPFAPLLLHAGPPAAAGIVVASCAVVASAAVVAGAAAPGAAVVGAAAPVAVAVGGMRNLMGGLHWAPCQRLPDEGGLGVQLCLLEGGFDPGIPGSGFEGREASLGVRGGLVGEDDGLMAVLAGVSLSAVPVKLEPSGLRVKIEEEFELMGEDADGRSLLAGVGGDDLMCSVGVRYTADGLESPFAEVLVEADVEPRVGEVVNHPEVVDAGGPERAVKRFAEEFLAEEDADRELQAFGDVLQGGHSESVELLPPGP